MPGLSLLVVPVEGGWGRKIQCIKKFSKNVRCKFRSVMRGRYPHSGHREAHHQHTHVGRPMCAHPCRQTVHTLSLSLSVALSLSLSCSSLSLSRSCFSLSVYCLSLSGETRTHLAFLLICIRQVPSPCTGNVPASWAAFASC
jgi:hypothetical protein